MQMKEKTQISMRNSNIEALKILAMILICICHTVTELSNNRYIFFSDFLVSWNMPSVEIVNYVLSVIHQFGLLGNTIFFVCSAWFMLDDNKVSIKKIISIMLDIEVISVLFILAYLIALGSGASIGLAVKMLFPHTLRLFWYLTCYLIIYSIHARLNAIIEGMTKRELLICVIFAAVYIVYGYFTRWYFCNVLVSWIALYFQMAYLKKYLTVQMDNITLNVFSLVIGIVGCLIIPLAINLLGIKYSSDSLSLSMFDDISRWNPFHIMISVVLMNFALGLKPKHNMYINYLAGLSPLVFIIHSNRIVREFFIPNAWHMVYVYSRGGWNSNIIIYAVILGVSLYMISILIGSAYKLLLQTRIVAIATVIAEWCNSAFNSLVNELLKG